VSGEVIPFRKRSDPDRLAEHMEASANRLAEALARADCDELRLAAAMRWQGEAGGNLIAAGVDPEEVVETVNAVARRALQKLSERDGAH